MISRVLLLGGMTRNDRIFERLLPLLPNASIVSWIDPLAHEEIPVYAQRLAATLRPVDDCLVCGVSFGGIIARELAHALSARGCVLISSIRSEFELPPWLRIFRYVPLAKSESQLATVGRLASRFPRSLRLRSTQRLSKLAGASGSWHRWATAATLRWQARSELDRIPVIQVHGDADQTFPLRYVTPEVVIAGGGHVLPLTHPEQLASVIVRASSQPSSPELAFKK